jgi:hypothetical protein
VAVHRVNEGATRQSREREQAESYQDHLAHTSSKGAEDLASFYQIPRCYGVARWGGALWVITV